MHLGYKGCTVGLSPTRVRVTDHLFRLPIRRKAKTFGAAAAVLFVVAGAITALGAGTVVADAAPAAALTCNDTWTGAAGTTDWNTPANWSAGIPNTTSFDACISGNSTVVVPNASLSIGELTVSAGSTLAVGASEGGTGTDVASLSVLSGLANSGNLTVGPSGKSGNASLTLNGPITNTGALNTDGVVTIGNLAPTSVSNDGTIGVAPGGLITVDSSSITNTSNGVLAFGIDGVPGSTTNYGRITGGTLSLGGSADAVFDNGFTPQTGAEYFVYSTGTVRGTFATVVHDAIADYSHAGEVGLTGGAPASPTTTAVTSSVPTSSVSGEGVQFTATVTTSTGSNPTGSVSFYADNLLLGNSPVTTSAGVTTATLEVSNLAVGSDSITATYNGDVFFDASTSAVLSQVVGVDPASAITPSTSSAVPGQQVSTQTSVGSSSRTSTYGQSMTFTATVSPTQSASVDPTGTVTFYDTEDIPSSPIGTTAVSTTGGVTAATLTISSLGAGAHSVSATYSGDQTFSTSSSTTSADLTVSQATSTVTVAGSANPTVVDQTLTLIATISSPASGETGTVQFDDNGSMLGSGTVADGQATLQISSLTVGVHPITAIYEGDTNFVGPSSANTLTQTVNRAATSTAISSNYSPGTVGHAITYTATVTVNSPGAGTPTGSVSFSDGGIAISSCQNLPLPLAAPFRVTCPQRYGTNASHTITTTYGGDLNFLPSNGGPFTENPSQISPNDAGSQSSSSAPSDRRVGEAMTTVTVASSENPSTLGDAVTLTVTVSSSAPGQTGTIQLDDNGSMIGSSPVSGGQATFQISSLALGDHPITAIYEGDDNFVGTSSVNTVDQVVNP